MEIRLLFFKETGLLIPLKNQLKSFQRKYLLLRKEKSRRRFFLPKISLISILPKCTYHFPYWFHCPWPEPCSAPQRLARHK